MTDRGRAATLLVYVVDAKGPTMSVGWQVIAAARAREAGGDATALLAAAEHARSRMVQYVCMDALDFLHEGGRIGNASLWLGTLLNLKPIVYINHETGLVEPGDRVRTHGKAVERLYQSFFAAMDVTKPMRIAVLHGDVLTEAEQLAERIQREYEPSELLVHITGPGLGVNTGPGALALCGYTEQQIA